MIDAHHGWNKSFKPQVIGFILSLVLLLGSYFVFNEKGINYFNFIIILASLAAAQAIFQFIFFFHLGVESKPRWNLMIFLFMLLVSTILIGGSMWIMYHLDYNMMLTKSS